MIIAKRARRIVTRFTVLRVRLRLVQLAVDSSVVLPSLSTLARADSTIIISIIIISISFGSDWDFDLAEITTTATKATVKLLTET